MPREYLVGRCRGCGAVRNAASPQGVVHEAEFQQECDRAKLEFEKVAEPPTTAACRCWEYARACRELDVSPERVRAVVERDEESRSTIALLGQALEMARPLMPEYTGQGEYARDDVEAALAHARWYWDTYADPTPELTPEQLAMFKQLAGVASHD